MSVLFTWGEMYPGPTQMERTPFSFYFLPRVETKSNKTNRWDFFFQEKVMMGLYPPQILKHHKNNISIVQVAGVDGIMEQNSSGNRLFYTFNIW